MKVFITWSGSRSKLLAAKLRTWLPLALQNVKPYLSDDDIPTGARWLHSISSELESSDFGILCLTPENLRAPWINFEAGALSKKDNSRVVPMLFELQKRDIKPPLDQFQAAVFDRDGVQSLLRSINNAAGTEGRTESDLEKTF